MNLLTNILYRMLYWLLGSLRTARMIRRLRSSDERAATALVNAIRQWKAGDYTDHETTWFRSIEQLRKNLLSDSTVVAITDFGAGSLTYALSDEEMKQGKIVHRRIREICRSSANPKHWCRFLFSLVRQFRPERCLEFGTSLGISAAYLTAACELNSKGRVITLEGSESLSLRAMSNLNSLNLSRYEIVQGRFQESLPLVLQANAQIDFAFIDGHHDKHATIQYFEQLQPHLHHTAIIVFDDISWSIGMRQAWSAISKHPLVSYALDLFDMGICIVRKPDSR